MSRSDVARWNRVQVPDRVRARAYARWVPDGDCRISTYSTASHGYAQIGWQNRPERHVVLAHRAAWEFINGPVPPGKTLDHLCKTRRCVNPAHLRVLDNYENARRTNGRDWPIGQCVRGHSNDRLYRDSAGKRICRDCKKVWNANHEARKRARR